MHELYLSWDSLKSASYLVGCFFIHSGSRNENYLMSFYFLKADVLLKYQPSSETIFSSFFTLPLEGKNMDSVISCQEPKETTIYTVTLVTELYP